VSEPLYRVCSYFIPRLMFLNASQAAQIHWGDLVLALQGFPEDCLDLGSAEFWRCWMERWATLGHDYRRKASQSSSAAGRKTLLRSAAACFHWAEFMYFSDPVRKRELRHEAKRCFHASLELGGPRMRLGELVYGDVVMPYYLVFPEERDPRGGAAPCVILSNGLDSMTEVEIFAFAELFLARGMATFLFDGPGQGINLGQSPIAIQFEGVVERVIGFLEGQADVDAGSLGFFGVSFGGYLALRIARAIGSRFKGVINLSGGPRLAPFSSLPRRLKEDFQFAFLGGDAPGMQDVFRRLELDPSGALRTDVLSVHGALDDIFPLAELEALDRAWEDRHELRIYDTEAHVCLNYIGQYSVEIADWMSARLTARE